MELADEIKAKRKPDFNINPLIVNRWSPRAMTGEEIPDDDLMALFEAARWAPSAFNSQLWRFVYAKKGTEHWDRLFGLLNEWNQQWCKSAAALVVIISRKNFEYNDKPSNTYAFDTGAAWENLALEGTSRGIVVHGMSGFDYGKAKGELKVPENFEIIAMAAVGKRAGKEVLPPDMQKREEPSDRRPLKEIVMEGMFKG
jgi:nitroreductase